MAKCPNGHESEWNDYCSACGAPMAGAPDAAAPPASSAPAPASTTPPAPVAAPTESCPSCGEPRDPGAPFCESCGHDFASPTPTPAPTPTPVSAPAEGDDIAVVRVDRSYFDRHSADSA